MLSTILKKIPRTLLQRAPFKIGHIKNMDEENLRVKIKQMVDEPPVQITNRIYKPTYTIEFNREGEVLIYSGNPIKNSTIYFKYPLVFYESFIPLSILNYLLNPFEMVWYWPSFFLYFSTFLTIARINYFRNFIFHPNKIFLMRGGRALRIEAQTLGNHRYIYWVENQMLKPLTQSKMNFDDRDNADFLTEQGQLKYDLVVEGQEFKVWGVNTNDEQLHIKKAGGIVHHPQLFEAAMKGYNIDTTDFVINTADNVRYREGNHDQ